MLNKRARWTIAAKAIMEHKFPSWEDIVGHSAARDNATEHIHALGEFATEFAKWLKRFASCLYEYQQTERYQKAKQASLYALEQRGHKRRS